MIKTFKLIVEGNFLNLMKNIYKNLTANFIHNSEKLEPFQRSGIRQRYFLSPLLFNMKRK